ncbi:hypothetical protein [Natrinema sp. SYSU A 869]|nr:hypothetical protein [Natrinema sp. SYSU A 869]
MSLRQPSAAIFSIVAGGYIALLVQGWRATFSSRDTPHSGP